MITSNARRALSAALLGLALAFASIDGTPGLAAAPASNNCADRVVAQGTEQLIENLMGGIKASKKPLPVWAVDIAMRAYVTWQTYKNGQKVEEVQHEVLFVLKVVAEIKDLVEAGREMSEREYRLTRELLDAHARRIDEHAGRIRHIESKILRKGCGVGHAWRNGRCVDVAANPL